MFCKNCGTALPDGAQFCGTCGTAQTVPAAPAPVAEAPAAPQAPAQPVWTPPAYVYGSEQPAPAAAQPAFADPFAPAQPEPPKPKKKGKGLLIAGISVVAAAAVFLVCIAGPLWFGWFPNTKLTKQITKWFGSDEDYMSAVESETVDTLSNSISKGYGSAINTYKDNLAGNKYASTTISLEVGDTIKDLIYNAYADATGGEDATAQSTQISQLLSLLDGASISISGGKADDVYKMVMGLGLGGEELLSAGMIMDLANLKGYVAIPTISDTYIEISQIFEQLNADDFAAMEQAMGLLEALPSEEVVNNLLKKYIQLALDQFDNVSKDSDTLKVGSIEEKVTVLKTKIGQKDAMKAAKAVLKELKKDSQVEKVLMDVGDALGAIEGQDGYGQQLYDSLVEGLEQAESMLEAQDEYEDEEDDDTPESYIVLTDYVNGSHEIIGRKLATQYGDEKQEILYYATATKGKDFAFELEVSGMKVLTGKGTNQKGIINATYTIDGAMVMGMTGEEESMDLATIKVENYDTNGVAEGRMKGTFIIAPGAELMEQAMDGADLPAWLTSSVSLLDCNLKIEVDSAQTSGYFKVSLCNGSKTLVGIRVDMKITDEKVSVPNPDNTVDIENIEQWVDTVDLTDLIATLKKILPAELAGMLDDEEFLEDFKEGFLMGFGSAQDAPNDNWDDDYYGDDDWGDYYDEPNYDDPYANEFGGGVEDYIPEDDWYSNPDEYLGEPIYGSDGRVIGYA